MNVYSIEALSPYRIMLGFKYSNNDSEFLEEHGQTRFTQLEIGLLFIYIRFTKYHLNE